MSDNGPVLQWQGPDHVKALKAQKFGRVSKEWSRLQIFSPKETKRGRAEVELVGFSRPSAQHPWLHCFFVGFTRKMTLFHNWRPGQSHIRYEMGLLCSLRFVLAHFPAFFRRPSTVGKMSTHESSLLGDSLFYGVPQLFLSLIGPNIVNHRNPPVKGGSRFDPL